MKMSNDTYCVTFRGERTTERYYGHLERNVLAAGAKATEEAIARAVKEHNGRKRSGYEPRRARTPKR